MLQLVAVGVYLLPRWLPLIFLKGVRLETDLITIQNTWEMQSVAFMILLRKGPWRF